jgi:hypothetical protein
MPSAPSLVINGEALFRGPLVAMGISTGSLADGSITTIQPEPRTGRAKYLGSLLNHAARVASVAHGGQIVASDRTLKACGFQACTASGISMRDLGDFRMKGFAGRHKLWEVGDWLLARRKFPQPRLGKVEHLSRHGEDPSSAACIMSTSGNWSRVSSVDVLLHDSGPASPVPRSPGLTSRGSGGSVGMGPGFFLDSLNAIRGTRGPLSPLPEDGSQAMTPQLSMYDSAVMGLDGQPSACSLDAVLAKYEAPGSFEVEAHGLPSLREPQSSGGGLRYVAGAPPSSLTAAWVAAGPHSRVSTGARRPPRPPLSLGTRRSAVLAVGVADKVRLLELGKVIDLGAPLSLDEDGFVALQQQRPASDSLACIASPFSGSRVPQWSGLETPGTSSGDGTPVDTPTASPPHSWSGDWHNSRAWYHDPLSKHGLPPSQLFQAEAAELRRRTLVWWGSAGEAAAPSQLVRWDARASGGPRSAGDACFAHDPDTRPVRGPRSAGDVPASPRPKAASLNVLGSAAAFEAAMQASVTPPSSNTGSSHPPRGEARPSTGPLIVPRRSDAATRGPAQVLRFARSSDSMHTAASTLRGSLRYSASEDSGSINFLCGVGPAAPPGWTPCSDAPPETPVETGPRHVWDSESVNPSSAADA